MFTNKTILKERADKIKNILQTSLFWKNIENIAFRNDYPIIRAEVGERNLKCTFSFGNGFDVEKSQTIEKYLTNYPICKSIHLFIQSYIFKIVFFYLLYSENND